MQLPRGPSFRSLSIIRRQEAPVSPNLRTSVEIAVSVSRETSFEACVECALWTGSVFPSRRRPRRVKRLKSGAMSTTAIAPLMAIPQAKFARLLPNSPLPRYTHGPGSGTPHPYRDPRGHSYNQRPMNPKPLTPDRWAENRSYLLGLDHFNLGFYWEAHDEWDRLWRSTGAESLVGRFLKGLVKMAAAGIKVREESIHGVRRHAASAGEVFADVAAESDLDKYCGLDFTLLQFAADRAAQLRYPSELEIGRPLRVFPFLLMPEPLPLM